MKKKKIFALMAAALSLAACSTNDVADITLDDADNVVNVASATRASNASAEDMTAPFHLINITQRTKNSVNFEADFTHNGSAYASTDGKKVVWYNGTDADGNEIENEFEAFSPLTTPYNLASSSYFHLPTDQSTADLLASADWMTAGTTMKKSTANGAISLNFEHKLSKLHFDVIAKDDATNMRSSNFKVINSSITPYYDNSSTTTTIEAIVEPRDDAYTTNDELINITLDNETFSLKFPSEITFEAGKQYNFNLAIGHDALSISSVSVSDWGDGSVTTDEDEAWVGPFDDSNVEYITFKADSEQGFMFYDTLYGSTLSGFEYSVNNEDWIVIPSEGITEAIPFGGTIGTLRLRGKNLNGTATGYYGNQAGIISFTNNNVPVACTGDIRTLLDYEHYTTVSTEKARFAYLFQNCTQLTSAPKLPATDLCDACYICMFKGCTSLTTAPELPATILNEICYQAMFSGCTSLTTAPELKATTLVKQCYDGMFEGCTNLSSVTMLATNIPDCSYIRKWLYNAGTGAQSRTLKLKNETVYNTIKDKTDDYYYAPILPEIWKSGTNGATVIYEDNNP